MNPDQLAMQKHIVAQSGIVKSFEVESCVQHIVKFLADYLRSSGLSCFVVGVSGGVDSLTTGLLTREAVNYLKAEHKYNAKLIAVRMPYGQQIDSIDAEQSVKLMQADESMVLNIKEPADSLMQSLLEQGLTFQNDAKKDFILGNIKARQRMVALFAIAGAKSGLVVGTDNAAENLVGFSTKYGDNAADVMPLGRLSKRMVKKVASYLGAPDKLVNKVPTADLESLNPQQSDEDSLGVSYKYIDDFLEGKAIPLAAYERIIYLWNSSSHKRSMPAMPNPIAN